MKRIRKICPLLAAFWAFLGCFLPSSGFLYAKASSVPVVLVSIKPLHSLVAGVMEGAGTPELLIRGSNSPHHFFLRPSDIKSLNRADLLVWIGPGFEGFLEKPLRNQEGKLNSLSLAEAFRERLLPLDPDHDVENHDHGFLHGDPALDYHFWLDTNFAKEILFLTAERLSFLDPSRKTLYVTNAENMAEKLMVLDLEIKEKLKPVQEIPYLVFHPAYQYFEKAYGLNHAGVIALDPERRPGARKLAEIRKRIRDLKVQCIFSEPQFESRLVATLMEGLDVRKGVLDPLGSELPENSEMYFTLMRNLAENFLKGLSKESLSQGAP